jgi:hypothetical protein
MSAPDLGAAILASLDEETIRGLAERLRPHLEVRPDHGPLLTPAQRRSGCGCIPRPSCGWHATDACPPSIGTGWRFHADQLHIASPSRLVAVDTSGAARRRSGSVEPASVAAIRGRRERSAA